MEIGNPGPLGDLARAFYVYGYAQGAYAYRYPRSGSGNESATTRSVGPAKVNMKKGAVDLPKSTNDDDYTGISQLFDEDPIPTGFLTSAKAENTAIAPVEATEVKDKSTYGKNPCSHLSDQRLTTARSLHETLRQR